MQDILSQQICANQTVEFLRSNDQFLILTHKKPDGDTLGCAAALCAGLRTAGKRAYVLKNPETGTRYIEYVAPYHAPPDFVPNTVITVDTADVRIVQQNAEGYIDKLDLAIDHHPSNNGYAKFLHNEPTAAACGEVVFELLLRLVGPLGITEQMATPLYVAIATDTGCFAYSNVTANTLMAAGTLVRAGAKHVEVNRRLFRTKTHGRIALEGVLLNDLQYYHNNRTAVSVITPQLLAQTGATEDDLDDIANLPILAESVCVGLTLKAERGGYKTSVRSIPDYSANDICKALGGGGHRMAAGVFLDMPLDDAIARLLAEIEMHYAKESAV